MGEALRGGPEGSALKAGVETAEQIGAYLARQRKLRGVSLDELESLTRIPKRSLERLEAGVFDSDRDAFARSFVRTVALALGLDAADAVARMLPEYETRRRSRGGHAAGSRVAVVLGAGIVVATILALALALLRGGIRLPTLASSGEGSSHEIVRRPNPVYALLPEWRARQAALRARAELEARLAAEEAARERAAAEARARAEAQARAAGPRAATAEAGAAASDAGHAGAASAERSPTAPVRPLDPPAPGPPVAR
jgi:hypothetical protein